MPSMIWYFAYGSNLSDVLVRAHTGEIAEEKTGKLDNYEILFNKKARDGSATANIRPTPGKVVYGVLYQISEAALRALERLEGGPEHYHRSEVNVTDGEGNSVSAEALVATKVEKGLHPAGPYLEAVLHAAEERHFPAEYIKELKAAAQAG